MLKKKLAKRHIMPMCIPSCTPCKSFCLYYNSLMYPKITNQ